jgi:hypothetical protein
MATTPALIKWWRTGRNPARCIHSETTSGGAKAEMELVRYR